MKIDIITTGTCSVDEGSYSYEGFDIDIMADGQVVGCASVLQYNDGMVLLDRIDIDADHRGQGIGTAAIEAIGAEYGTLIVAPDNEDARRLYDRLGYDVSRDHWMIDQGYGVYSI